jgi:vancomycin resistance protein YoaR
MRRSKPVACVTFALLLAATLARAYDAPSPASGPMRADSLATEPSAADFPVVLGSFSTTLVGSLPERTHNVRLTVRALDGAVLRPGEELSFNDRVGPRTAERGYEPAPVILREVRQVQIGGGVCQVASTLFDAALLAGLTPVERHRHSSPVDYVALGEDATIAWGVKDLRVRNDLAQDVRLRIELVGSTLVARFEGGEEGDAYELETVVDDSPAPDDVAGLPGRDVELYRVRVGGDADRELIHRDHYPPSRTRFGER